MENSPSTAWSTQQICIIGDIIGEHLMFEYWFGAHNATIIQGTYPLLLSIIGLKVYIVAPWIVPGVPGWAIACCALEVHLGRTTAATRPGQMSQLVSCARGGALRCGTAGGFKLHKVLLVVQK